LDNALSCYTQFTKTIKYEFIFWYSGVGISACCFFGGRSKSCGLSDVQVIDTPTTWTALCYNGVKVDSNYHISVPCMCKEDNMTLGSITHL
jgi:hypothetical protein